MKYHLSSRVFYGIIVAGVLLGLSAATLGGWFYLEYSDREPTGQRIWGDVAKWFVVPICAMIGTTFGGLFGFVIAAVWDHRRRKSAETPLT